MSLKKELSNLLKDYPDIIEHSLKGNDEAPEVFFRLNTGSGQLTDKLGDIHRFNRFYQFKGHVKDAGELEYRLKYRQPPE